MRMNHKINCNNWKGLCNLMKIFTNWYMPKKNDIITYDQFKYLIKKNLIRWINF